MKVEWLCVRRGYEKEGLCDCFPSAMWVNDEWEKDRFAVRRLFMTVLSLDVLCGVSEFVLT